MKNILLTLMLALAATPFAMACDDDGPAEEAGEDIDNAVDEAGDEIDEASDEYGASGAGGQFLF